MREATDVVLMLTTFPSAQEAQQVAATLLDEHLIACATLLPGCTSMYAWEGTITVAPETQLLLKTRGELTDQVGSRLQSLHPYSTPEILVLKTGGGLAAYLDWVDASTRT